MHSATDKLAPRHEEGRPRPEGSSARDHIHLSLKLQRGIHRNDPRGAQISSALTIPVSRRTHIHILIIMYRNMASRRSSRPSSPTPPTFPSLPPTDYTLAGDCPQMDLNTLALSAACLTCAKVTSSRLGCRLTVDGIVGGKLSMSAMVEMTSALCSE